MEYHVLEKARNALDHYFHLMTEEEHDIKVEIADMHVEEPSLDDAYRISISAGKGIIEASNPRAALIGVYHFLRENGCTFVRPGSASERIPSRKKEEIAASLEVRAAHRFRGLCIEGACNLENTLDLIEWMPKVGFNCYFMQFREGYNFFQRWYECEANRSMTPWEFNLEVCRSIVPRIERTAHENGLLYHAAGHGFTCECFGVSGLGWIQMDWPKNAEYALAERSGVRDLDDHMPLISALCYSNPEVQEKVVDGAVEYIEKHPEIDFVHFWLDDGNNNKCECEACRDTRVADFYIQMLNRLDQKLSEKGLNNKIVFLAYHELLWPPQREKLRNPERFIFMFAPIQRSFLETLPDASQAGEMQPYTLNHQPFPKSNEEMVSHLKAWNRYRKENGMDMQNSFDFDYYCNDYNDPGQFIQTKLLYEDIRGMKKNGLDGIINCQAQRSFDHAALPMYVMARALVQPELSLDELTGEFFYGAFGDEGEEYCQRWMELTEASALLRDKTAEGSFERLLWLLQKPLPQTVPQDLATSHSRKLMKFNLEIFSFLTRIVSCLHAGDECSAREIKQVMERFTSEKECEYAQEFDRKYFEEEADRLYEYHRNGKKES